MQNNKLNNIVHEINEFIKIKVGLLLNDLLVESDEYEKTKLQLLNLPFIQKIINEMANKQMHENQFIHQEQPNIKIEKCNFFEPCDLTDDIKDMFFETEPYNLYDAERERIYYEKENICLNIEDPHLDNVDAIDNLNMHNINIVIDITDTEDSVDVEEENEVVDELTEKEDEEVVVESAEEEQEETDELVEEEEEVVAESSEEEQEESNELEEEQEETDELVEEEEEVVAESSEEEQEDDQEDELEEEEEGVFEIEINGTTYFTDNEKNGTIYSIDENGDPDEEIGTFVNGTPRFTNKQ